MKTSLYTCVSCGNKFTSNHKTSLCTECTDCLCKQAVPWPVERDYAIEGEA